MIRPELPKATRPRWWRWWAATVVLLVGAAVLLVAGTGGGSTPDALASARLLPPPVAGAPAPAVGEPLVGDPSVGAPAPAADPPVAVGPAVPRSAPVELRIPAIGVSVPLSGLGLNPDNTVEVPTDFQKAGWFELGPSPGQEGSAVILGHVDSYKGPAVFFRLRSLLAGDGVEVELADGAVAHFAVTAVETYPKAQFPAQQVYGANGGSALQLVTCGGEFDRSARSYLSNVVVYTSLVAMTPAADPGGPGLPD